MRKALATIATGPAAELLALSFPTFLDYAARHGYDIVVGNDSEHDRSPAWGRVPLLQKLLQTYDFVVWLDADLVILDTKPDVESVMPRDAFQALVVAKRENDSLPLAGVWALRAGPRANAFLSRVWMQTDLISH